MKFILEIDCSNAAFSPSASEEIARIIRAEVLPSLDDMGDFTSTRIYLHDVNGKKVGQAVLNEESKRTSKSKRS